MTLTWDELTLSADAFSWAADQPGREPDYFTRVYLARGRYAHLREEDGSGDIACYPPGSPEDGRDDRWLGTGTQREYETAARMPLCPHCFGWREGSSCDDPRLGTAHGTDMRDYAG